MKIFKNAEQTVTKPEAMKDMIPSLLKIKHFRWCQLLSYLESGFSHIINVDDAYILPITEEDARAYQNLIEYDDRNNPLPAANMSHQEVDAFLDRFAEVLWNTYELDDCLIDEDGDQPVILKGAGVDYIRSLFAHWYEDGHMPVYTIKDYLFDHISK